MKLNTVLKFLIILLIFVGNTSVTKAQLTVNSAVTANNLITTISGPGVIITNPVLTCSNGNYATFSGGLPDLGMGQGILLATGNANVAIGPNNSVGAGTDDLSTLNDVDLTNIQSNATYNVCRLEFDIVPLCDTLRLDYIFASEEYPEYVCSVFNDAFGFFISGPNPAGGNYVAQNVAIIPGTNIPVAINTVNSGVVGALGTASNCSAADPSWTANSVYYVDNTGGTAIQYDGFTTPLTAVIPVQSCATYRMKLIVGDAGDGAYDSGVFLEFQGLTCPIGSIDLQPIVNTAAEGCLDASFQLVANLILPTTVNLSTGGQATDGVDNTTITTSFNLPAGSSTNVVNVSAFADGIAEGTESLVVYAEYIACGSTTVYDTLILTILDQPTINFNSTIENCGACDGTASATFSNAALPIASYIWSPAPGGGQGTANATGLCQGNYILSIVDANGCPASDTVTIGTACSTCLITNFSVLQGFCDGVTNTFELTGSIEFSSAPATGTLTITADNGTTNYDTIINTPFTSPQTWSISGIPADGSNITITATFSSDATCTATLNTVAPPDCACPAYIGTFTTIINGDGQNNYQLCFGDVLEITSNNNYIYPNEATAPPAPAPFGYNPGIGYLLYSCPPTIGTVPSSDTSQVITNDPCFLGIISYGDDYDVINNIGAVGAPFTNSTIYIVPITFYDTINDLYSYTNTTITCFSMGTPFAVQYLPQVVSSNPIEDCVNGTFTITIDGGLPELDGSNFTASNLLPATASFVNTTTTNGGTIQINGLQNGDNYSFDIADANGCPITITGGPFVGLPTANAGVNDTSCTLTYNLNAIPSIGTGIWTGPANISFAPNATTPNATATSTLTGPYTITWTETNTPGCTDAQSIDITFTQMSIPNVLTNISCNGDNDGQIVVAPQGGITPYTYSWSTSSNITPVENNLSAGNVTITVTDANNCTLDSTFTLTEPAPFGLTITSITPVTCNGGNDGQATANVADIIDTYTYSWNTTPVQNTAMATNLTLGTYTVIATQASSGCTDTITATITEPPAVTIATISNDTTICSGQSTTLTATATGGSGTGYIYTWNNGLGAGQSQTVTPGTNTTTIYQVTAVDDNGCPADTQNVTVIVYPQLTVQATGIDTICPTGDQATLNALPTGGTGGPYTYTWTPSAGLSSTTIPNPTVSPLTATTYTVTLNDGCSPPDTDTVRVSLWSLPPLSALSTPPVCEDDGTITFFNMIDPSIVDTFSVKWFFGNGAEAQYPNWDTISYTYYPAGTYTVNMAANTLPALGGCRDTAIVASVVIYPMPIADFISTPNITSMFEPEIQFTDQSGSTIASWQWDFAGLDTSNYPNPLYIFPDDTNGVYPVKLTVTDINGCVDTITKIVTIIGEYGIYIPNAFTPDFDNKNDWFGPKGFGILSENYRFMIFDRWGEKMFDTDVLFKPWDGFYKGNRVQEGVYVWKLFFKDINKEKHELIGHVTIIQ